MLGAAREAGRPDRTLAERVSARTIEALGPRFAARIPDVEDIQDASSMR